MPALRLHSGCLPETMSAGLPALEYINTTLVMSVA